MTDHKGTTETEPCDDDGSRCVACDLIFIAMCTLALWWGGSGKPLFKEAKSECLATSKVVSISSVGFKGATVELGNGTITHLTVQQKTIRVGQPYCTQWSQ